MSDAPLSERFRFQTFDVRSRIHVREAVTEILREVVPENILAQEPLDDQTPLNRLFPKWGRSKQWSQFTQKLRKRKDYAIDSWRLPNSPICTKIGNLGCLTLVLLFPFFAICSLYIIGRGAALDLDADCLSIGVLGGTLYVFFVIFAFFVLFGLIGCFTGQSFPPEVQTVGELTEEIRKGNFVKLAGQLGLETLLENGEDRSFNSIAQRLRDEVLRQAIDALNTAIQRTAASPNRQNTPIDSVKLSDKLPELFPRKSLAKRWNLLICELYRHGLYVSWKKPSVRVPVPSFFLSKYGGWRLLALIAVLVAVILKFAGMDFSVLYFRMVLGYSIGITFLVLIFSISEDGLAKRWRDFYNLYRFTLNKSGEPPTVADLVNTVELGGNVWLLSQIFTDELELLPLLTPEQKSVVAQLREMTAGIYKSKPDDIQWRTNLE